MLPIFNDIIYAIDIEIKPLPQFEKQNKKIKKEEDNEDKIDVDEPNFLPWCSQIYGLSVAWGGTYDKTKYFYGEENIRQVLLLLSENKIKLSAHNVMFDWVNLYYHFEIPLNFVADSGVYVQCINNSDYVNSYGLKQSTKRIFGVEETQDQEIRDYLKENYKIIGNSYGEYIHYCPTELIEKYCRLDSMYCWKLIHETQHLLVSDISLYMKLYMNEVILSMKQFIAGIQIDREGFNKQKEILETEINTIENTFLNHPELVGYIQKVQMDRFSKELSKYKKKVIEFEEWNKNNKFNINSNSQLKQLFDYQGLHWDEKKKKFIYPHVNYFPGTRVKNQESPKLGTKFLHDYGVGGQILSNRGERVTLLQHIERALEDAKLTGSIHPKVNLLGTASGRISASGVNIIATPIADEAYGKNLIVEEGWTLVANDFSSLEPTLLACLSDDPLLKYACFEGEGKTPFVKDDRLWIDDNYLMACYSAPFMRNEIEDKLDLSNWVNDPDSEKKKVKEIRSIGKTIVLATNYGASAQKIQNTLRENLKKNIPLKNITEFQNNYWSTISKAYKYKKDLERQAEDVGYIINLGGFPLIFYDPLTKLKVGTHKALNRMLQSTAAIVMKLQLFYLYKLIRHKDYIIPQVSDWHDCHFFKVTTVHKDEFIQDVFTALEQVNDTLQLPLKLRMDKHMGRSFYDCK